MACLDLTPYSFGKSRAVTRRKYARFVEEGIQQASPWGNLKGQILLGSDDFVQNIAAHIQGKDGLDESPMAQRIAHRPDLSALLSESARSNKITRDAAIRLAYLEYRYSVAAIARQAGIHYSTVGKIIKGER